MAEKRHSLEVIEEGRKTGIKLYNEWSPTDINSNARYRATIDRAAMKIRNCEDPNEAALYLGGIINGYREAVVDEIKEKTKTERKREISKAREAPMPKTLPPPPPDPE